MKGSGVERTNPIPGTRVRFIDLFEFGEYLGIEEFATGTVLNKNTKFGVRVRWDDGREISVWAECLEMLKEENMNKEIEPLRKIYTGSMILESLKHLEDILDGQDIYILLFSDGSGAIHRADSELLLYNFDNLDEFIDFCEMNNIARLAVATKKK